MRSKKLMVKIMTGLIAAGLSLSTIVSVSAKSDDTTVSNTKSTIAQNKKGAFGGAIKTQLDTFVKSGIITQDQSDKIVEFINEKNETKKAEMEKCKSMTEEERKTYFENKKSTEKTNIFKELVDSGVINQDQADKLKAALPEKKGVGKEMGHGGKMNSENLKTTLDALVKSGKLTQAKEDKIISFMNEKDEARKAEMEKVKNMTKDERKAYFESQKGTEKTNMFKQLVDDGILTQAEVDAIKSALPKMERTKDKKANTTIDATTNSNEATN